MVQYGAVVLPNRALHLVITIVLILRVRHILHGMFPCIVHLVSRVAVVDIVVVA